MFRMSKTTKGIGQIVIASTIIHCRLNMFIHCILILKPFILTWKIMKIQKADIVKRNVREEVWCTLYTSS